MDAGEQKSRKGKEKRRNLIKAALAYVFVNGATLIAWDQGLTGLCGSQPPTLLWRWLWRYNATNQARDRFCPPVAAEADIDPSNAEASGTNTPVGKPVSLDENPQKLPREPQGASARPAIEGVDRTPNPPTTKTNGNPSRSRRDHVELVWNRQNEYNVIDQYPSKHASREKLGSVFSRRALVAKEPWRHLPPCDGFDDTFGSFTFTKGIWHTTFGPCEEL